MPTPSNNQDIGPERVTIFQRLFRGPMTVAGVAFVGGALFSIITFIFESDELEMGILGLPLIPFVFALIAYVITALILIFCIWPKIYYFVFRILLLGTILVSLGLSADIIMGKQQIKRERQLIDGAVSVANCSGLNYPHFWWSCIEKTLQNSLDKDACLDQARRMPKKYSLDAQRFCMVILEKKLLPGATSINECTNFPLLFKDCTKQQLHNEADYEQCLSIGQKNGLDTSVCHLTFATIAHDISLCEKLIVDNTQKYCELKVMESLPVSSVISTCNKFTNIYKKNSCFLFQARKKSDQIQSIDEICQNIDISLLIDGKNYFDSTSLFTNSEVYEMYCQKNKKIR